LGDSKFKVWFNVELGTRNREPRKEAKHVLSAVEGDAKVREITERKKL
jgi:hypothetical protein